MKVLFVLAVFLSLAHLTIAQDSDACTGGTYDMVRPFLGSWQEYTVTDNEEIFIGTLNSQMELNGCVITQRFYSADSSFSYQSFGYVEPASNILRETYVFSTGGISKYQWQLVEGEVVQLRIGGSRQIDYMHRLRFTNVTGDSYDVVEEHSQDGGRTWEQKELTRIKRVY